MVSASSPTSGSVRHEVTLRGITWEQYVALRAADDRPGLRMTYLDGVLEIMSPSDRHELDKTLIARLLEAYAEERGLYMDGYGSTTYRKKAKQAGLEPDECYVFGEAQGRPDLALEVAVSSGGIDKLEVYRRLGVPEVWVWGRGRFRVFSLGRGGYTEGVTSRFLPELDLAALGELVKRAGGRKQTEVVRAFRKSLQGG